MPILPVPMFVYRRGTGLDSHSLLLDEMVAKKTALHAAHQNAGAKLVPFAGWEMPLHYGSQINEHRAVRTGVGIFDVSHMGIIDMESEAALALLHRLVANDVAKLKKPGKAIYTCMLNERGGVLDDLIIYRLGEEAWRIVVNAATRDADLAWMQSVAAKFGVTLSSREDLSLIALQGPKAAATAEHVMPLYAPAMTAMRPFDILQLDNDVWAARTGYTGEDGWEIMAPAERVQSLWREFLDEGAVPCGLGARDSLRLEAGLNLYGQDMTDAITPYECGLRWTVALEPEDRDFIGRQALMAADSDWRFTGLLLEGRGVLRAGQSLATEAGPGVVTSGGFSPTLGRSIGLGRVPRSAGEACQVDIRGHMLSVRCVKPPFVRHGEALVE